MRKIRQRIKRRLGIFLTVTLLLGLTGCGRKDLLKMEEGQMVDLLAPAIVRMESGNLFGTGIVLEVREDSLLLITNRHMLEGGELSVIFWDGSRTTAQVLGESEAYDLGFLKVELSKLEEATAKDCHSIWYNTKAFEKSLAGDDIFILGSSDYPAGNLFYGTIGNKSVYMEDFGTEMLWAYCEVKPGMSGSGVFDRYGNLIGMVCGGNEEKEAAALPITVILDEWKQGGY